MSPITLGEEFHPIEVELKPGFYQIECWGAQGGIGRSDGTLLRRGGPGSYTSGFVSFHSHKKLFLYIGSEGQNGSTAKNTVAAGGFNGGGNGGSDTNDDDGSGGGGGATDVRLIGGYWNDINSLISRIMVAAGGSGSAYTAYGAPDGDIFGYGTSANSAYSFHQTDTSQTEGYSLGIGGNGLNNPGVPSSGSGGGYYGGYAATEFSPQYKAVSSSGSSFVSGYESCNALDSDGNHTGSSVHYSGITFDRALIINGYGSYPSPYNIVDQGYSGNGVVKITIINIFSRYSSQCATYFSFAKMVAALLILCHSP